MRAHEWRTTTLGDIETWPESLRSALSICLGSGFPIAIYWGQRLSLLYNDAWSPILGKKHPWALGRDGADVWPEIWDTVGPLFAQVLETGAATFSQDSLLPMHRHGYTEECYFDYTFSPIRGATGQVEGVFNAAIETTWRVLNERRTMVLRELAEDLMAASSVQAACTLSMQRLGQASRDVAFGALFMKRPGTDVLDLIAHHGLDAEALRDLDSGDPRWPFRAAADSGQTQLVEELVDRLGFEPGGGAWPEPADQAVLTALPDGGGFLLLGAAPRRAVDDEYRAFVERIAAHIGRAISSAAELTAQRERAEALAELDRAKTAFFSNVSHEFRTPLTLLLGPVEELLARGPDAGGADPRAALQVVRRNGRRLLKLVNTLLDFARIEAGRTQAVFEPTDLAEFTRDLVSSFQSACDHAGLALQVDCAPLGEPVWVDRTMWEKIVLNLVSNAFKFTWRGSITVGLAREPGRIVLRVADTGCGIAADERPRLFERFHRIEGTRGRSHEGSGIGLALVLELVKCHEGRIEVESEVDRGTTFVVEIPDRPRGSGEASAAPKDHDAAIHAYVDEALGWLPNTERRERRSARQHRVLLVDDNRDLRDYASGLLEDVYEVEAVADGEEALLAARRQRPDLIVSDVMMPRLDGIGLLRELRADPKLRTVPVVLLSARAGEEARLEGLGLGADDYLVKPFTARELLVRVGALLRSQQARAETEAVLRHSEQRLWTFANAAPAMLWVTGPDGECTFLSRGWYEFTGRTETSGHAQWRDAVHPDDRENLARTFAERVQERTPFRIEYRLQLAGGGHRWVMDTARPQFDADHEFLGHIGSIIDVHEQREVAQALRSSEERYRAVIESQAEMVCRFRLDGTILFANGAYARARRTTVEQLLGADLWQFVAEADRPAVREALSRMTPATPEIRVENRFETLAGERWVLWTNRALAFDEAGAVVEAQSTGVDITDRKLAEAALSEEARALELLNQVGVSLAADPDLERTVQHVTDAATEVAGARFGAFFYNMRTAEGGAYMLFSLSGATREEFERFGMPRNTAVFGPTFAGERPIRLEDVTKDPRYGLSAPHHGMPKGHLPVRSYLAVPVVSRTGEVIGGLFLGHPEPGVFTARDERIVVGIAAQAAVAIDNARLHGERLHLIESLREADRAKNEFLATLSHELRNPLSPLRNALYLLRHGGSAVVGEVQELMERQVQHLVRLVDDLMETTRIVRGTFELRPESVLLQDVVRGALETCDPDLEAAGHQLTVTMPDEAIPVHADRVRLVQVFTNLLNNAVRYTQGGGEIAVVVERVGRDAVVHVRDNGEGIEPGEMPRLFQMFNRGNRTSRQRQEGLGIGLALAKRLVEMHGGTIGASSDGPGRGSCFTVQLPVAAAAPAAAAPFEARRPLAQRVLVVDDNEDAARSLGMLLRLLGADVVTVFDGPAALAAFAAHRPSVVLLDIGMPGMSGYDVARAIRARADGTAVRLVAISGWGQEADRREAKEAGFDDHIVKPADIGVLQSLLANHAG